MATRRNLYGLDGARAAYAGLTVAGLAGLLLLWLRMPETHRTATRRRNRVYAK